MVDRSGQASAERERPQAHSTPGTAPPRRSRRPRPRFRPGALLVGLIGLVAGLAVPLAPVVNEDVVVTWPQSGRQPESTLAFFVPYEPAEVHVQVPCPVVQAGIRHSPSTTLASSRPVGQPTEGFAVTTGAEDVLVLVGGVEVLRAPATGDCAVSLDADHGGSTARIGDRVVHQPDRRVEEINAFTTDLDPAQASGMSVTAKTANWFENSPTEAKQNLILLQLAMALLALVLLARSDRGAVRTPRGRGGAFRGFADFGVVAGLGWWLVYGPNSPDDSFASMTIRNALRTGDVGNYYRWENASESPFTLAQRLLEWFAAQDPSPVSMRIPSVVAGALTWFLLARGVLNQVLPHHGRRTSVRFLAAVAFLGWWLPFGLGVRPEAFSTLMLTAVLAFLLLGVVRERRFWIGLAALMAGLSLAVNAMGIASLAPLIVLAPQVWRLVRGPGVVARVALLACLGSTGAVAIFADQSLFGVLEATRLHKYYGPNVQWYQEIIRYEYLLGFDLQGDLARRAPVLLSGVVLVFCAMLLGRGARWLPGMHLAHVPPTCFAISLVLLGLTPSKWTHYFGALAGVGAATLTAGAVLILVVAQHWAGYRSVQLLGLLCTALSVIAAALTFAGKNNWFFYSHFGVPWGEEPVRPLNSPVPWLALVAALLVASTLTAVARKKPGGQPVLRMLVRMPAVLSVLAMGGTVLILFASFGVAPTRQAGSYSVGAQNSASMSGPDCGLADHIVLTEDVPGGSLALATESEELVGFTRGTGFAEPPPQAEHLWGSLAAGEISTGTLTSGWFTLPDVPATRELAVSVAGRSGDGNRLALEFGADAPEGVRPLGERVLQDTDEDADERPIYPTDHVIEDEPQDRPSWRDLQVAAHEIPRGADLVRVRASDGTTDPGGWIGVTGPRLRELTPMNEYLREQESVFIDWSMTWAFPCVHDFPAVGDGLVEPPEVVITAPASMGFGGEAPFTRSIGGSFVGVVETGEQTEIPTRLLGVEDKPEYRDWGHLTTVEYPLPDDRYDVHSVPVTRWGWRGE